VSSVVLERRCRIATAASSRRPVASAFEVLEDDVPQSSTWCGQEDAAGHLHAARGQQPEHVAAHRLRAAMRPPRWPPICGRRTGSSSRRSRRPSARRPGPPTTATRDGGDRGIRALRRHGDPRRALEESTRLAPASRARHAIVLITDGYDEHSTTDVRRGARDRPESGASVYVVGIGGVAGISLKGERFLKQLATRPAGARTFRRARSSCAGARAGRRRTCSFGT
jgi:hypothetical protein